MNQAFFIFVRYNCGYTPQMPFLEVLFFVHLLEFALNSAGIELATPGAAPGVNGIDVTLQTSVLWPVLETLKKVVAQCKLSEFVQIGYLDEREGIIRDWVIHPMQTPLMEIWGTFLLQPTDTT